MELNVITTPMTLPDEANNKVNADCRSFTESMEGKGQSLEYYEENRAAWDPWYDVFVGKKAEYFASLYMTYKKDYPLVYPDVSVRQGYRKGWGFDLTYEDLPSVHVKSCTQRTIDSVGDYSWTWQWKNQHDDGGRDRVFTQEEPGLVVCVFLPSLSAPTADIKLVLPTEMMLEKVRDPKSTTHIGFKKCLYFADFSNDPLPPRYKDICNSPTLSSADLDAMIGGLGV